MATTQIPNRLIVAYCKCTFINRFENQVQEAVVYRKFITPTQEQMDFAILNYAKKYGLLSVETIKPEEYEEITGESIS
tara:strand:- start:427 stop:660 length:234 start_codon:yes stop_codon:yes gene_type:complete